MDFQNTKAIYLQIANFICEQILLKKQAAGEKISSVRELAVSLEVNPNTVMRTYSYLEEKNIITMQRGIGYFIADNAYQRVVDLKKTEFLTTDLPNLFHSMDLLNIDFNQIKQLYLKRDRHEKE